MGRELPWHVALLVAYESRLLNGGDGGTAWVAQECPYASEALGLTPRRWRPWGGGSAMASSRRAARAIVAAPVVEMKQGPRVRRTCHSGPRFDGLIWWEDDWPVKIYSAAWESTLVGPKAVAFLLSLGWKMPDS